MTTPLRIIPVGGLGEIGKNMMLIEYGTDGIIIDTGMMFPENDMLGIDYIIPDFQFIFERGLTIRGILLTHGHEDHVGAITHVLDAFPGTPVYGTRLTIGFVEVKLRQNRMLDKTVLNIFQAGDVLEIGPFRVDTFHQTHSIPDCVGFGIETPAGLIVHTGDFKFDHTPSDGWPPDFSKIAEFSKRGVLALMSDSTNAVRTDWTPSETTVDAGLERVFRQAAGRVIVATFASHIGRIQQIARVAMRHNRKIAITGYSMIENIRMATSLGYIDLPADLIISLEHVKTMAPNRVAILSTGTQGEPTAVLSRLAQGRHRQLDVQAGDTVIMSAHVIPGNEELVSRTINKLIQRGAHVFYHPIEQVHVSGHASGEELKLMLNLVRPRYFVPVHGELRHLTQHAQIARELGIPEQNIAIVENGTVIEFIDGRMSVGKRVPGRYVFVDGAGVGDVGPSVLRDREILGQDGFVLAVITLDARTGELIGEPEIISRGFVYLPDAETLFADARDRLRQAIQESDGQTAPRKRAERLEGVLRNVFQQETQRRPMIFVHVSEV